MAAGLLLLCAARLAAQAVVPPSLPEAPAPQQAQPRTVTGASSCVSAAYTATNPEAAADALVMSKPCGRRENPFNRFLSTSEPLPLTPLQKLELARRNLTDPFNLLTIAANSTIYIGANAHNPYGPGMKGWSYNVAVSLSEDATGEFFNTFLIPTIVREDPHYHRMPGAGVVARMAHVVVATAVMQSDSGRPMFNYADFVGLPIDAAIGNLYVPGLQTNLKATTARVSIGLAAIPIGNAIAEFMPDLARHVNVHVIFAQRIIDQVAREGQSTYNF